MKILNTCLRSPEKNERYGLELRAKRIVRITSLVFAATLLFSLLHIADMVFAQEDTSQEDLELARLYAPVLYFHPAELFRPQSVDVMVNSARLRQTRREWMDINVLNKVSLSDLFSYKDVSYHLDVWFNDEGASDYKNYSAHRAYYQSVLSPESGGPPIVAYAHVVRDENLQHINLQYWLFYYYNDWFNKHEGDWEMVQVILSASGEPEWVVLSQHHGGTRRPWPQVRIEEGTHPAVYVALGSHANYFWGEEAYPNGTKVGNVQVEIMDRTGEFGRVIPEVRMIPDREEVEKDPGKWAGLEWLPFRGHWGEKAPHSDFSGPLGPADKGLQWEGPHEWGMNQPQDLEIWYQNRLRVEVRGEGTERAQITLRLSDRQDLPSLESLGSVSLLHIDPPLNKAIIGEIEIPSRSPYQILITWPNPETSEVTHYIFTDVPPSLSGRAVLTLMEGELPKLSVPGLYYVLMPRTVETVPATWDAPDLVWVAGMLPASDVVKGVGTCLLAGLLPTLIYAVVLYYSDRYEREPKALIAAAFFWGAWPALLVAVIVRVFFQLPVDLIGSQAIEAVRAGLVTPFIEEALKGVAVILILVLYRREFDNVLDGIIYGAMVGFGFAMTGNTLSYLGAFLLRGFSGLSNTIFIQGVIYGLNHGVYSAIFGAGLGYARMAKVKWQRWAVPSAAFVLAVLSHGLHNLVLQIALGMNLLTILLTWVGILVVVVVMLWSLRRQQQCLTMELVGEIPDDLYRTLTERGGRNRARWRALRKDGVGGLRLEMRLHRQCAELAFKKMQQKSRPEEAGVLEETDRLRKEIKAII
jgi:RsiW-degrading membrane proteinase PrsW (M82 family)